MDAGAPVTSPFLGTPDLSALMPVDGEVRKQSRRENEYACSINRI